MTFVLNRNWGGFRLPQKFCDTYGIHNPWAYIERDDPLLLKWMQEYGDSRGRCGDLAVVEIPDESTDWELNEYDGMESITYVVDGKLHHA